MRGGSDAQWRVVHRASVFLDGVFPGRIAIAPVRRTLDSRPRQRRTIMTIRTASARTLLAAAIAALASLAAPAAWALPSQYHVTPLGNRIVGKHLDGGGQVAVIDESAG